MQNSPRWSQGAEFEAGARRRSSGGTVSYDGGMSSHREHFLRGTRRMSKDGTRRDQPRGARRSRRGGGAPATVSSSVLPWLVIPFLLLVAWFVATKVPRLVTRLFLGSDEV